MAGYNPFQVTFSVPAADGANGLWTFTGANADQFFDNIAAAASRVPEIKAIIGEQLAMTRAQVTAARVHNNAEPARAAAAGNAARRQREQTVIEQSGGRNGATLPDTGTSEHGDPLPRAPHQAGVLPTCTGHQQAHRSNFGGLYCKGKGDGGHGVNARGYCKWEHRCDARCEHDPAGSGDSRSAVAA